MLLTELMRQHKRLCEVKVWILKHIFEKRCSRTHSY